MLTARISMARSTPMTEAAQPMPERLKVRMLCLNLKWFTTAADSDGVGLKAEQFTMRPSICRANIASGHAAAHPPALLVGRPSLHAARHGMQHSG